MVEIILNLLPEILTGVIALIFGWLAPSPMYNKIKRAGKTLFDAIEDNKISPKEEKAIADSFKSIFDKA